MGETVVLVSIAYQKLSCRIEGLQESFSRNIHQRRPVVKEEVNKSSRKRHGIDLNLNLQIESREPSFLEIGKRVNFDGVVEERC